MFVEFRADLVDAVGQLATLILHPGSELILSLREPVETFVDSIETFVDSIEALVDSVETGVDPIETRAELVESSICSVSERVDATSETLADVIDSLPEIEEAPDEGRPQQSDQSPGEPFHEQQRSNPLRQKSGWDHRRRAGPQKGTGLARFF